MRLEAIQCLPEAFRLTYVSQPGAIVACSESCLRHQAISVEAFARKTADK